MLEQDVCASYDQRLRRKLTNCRRTRAAAALLSPASVISTVSMQKCSKEVSLLTNAGIAMTTLEADEEDEE